jgi:hypothetical protein
MFAIKKVASAGPAANPDANNPSWMEFALSRVILAGFATSGISDFLAVLPPGVKRALKMLIKINQARVSSQRPETIGIIRATTPAKISEPMAVFLLPTLSIKDPRKGASSRVGIAVSATTRPALVAVPVSSRAIQGIAINVIDPEMTEATDASWVKTKGASLRCT